jgi:hypothetical protein
MRRAHRTEGRPTPEPVMLMSKTPKRGLIKATDGRYHTSNREWQGFPFQQAQGFILQIAKLRSAAKLTQKR